MAYPYLGDLLKALTGLDLPLPLPTFGLMVAVALLVSMSVFERELRRLHEAGHIGLLSRRVKGRNVVLPPQAYASEFSFIVVVAGLVGARLFHILEYPQEFMAHPWDMILSRSGMTIFGGLIVGALAGVAFLKRHGFPVLRVCDAIAPVLMLGYAIGRIGCQLSGDGDWGIEANLALKPDWLPLWLWAQTYDHNIVGVAIAAPGVYPAPIYETLMALMAFALLWRVRKHSLRAGWLFALYLLLSGVERLLIEQIRVNAVYDIFGLHVTQAEIISTALIALGLAGLAWLTARPSAAITCQPV